MGVRKSILVVGYDQYFYHKRALETFIIMRTKLKHNQSSAYCYSFYIVVMVVFDFKEINKVRNSGFSTTNCRRNKIFRNKHELFHQFIEYNKKSEAQQDSGDRIVVIVFIQVTGIKFLVGKTITLQKKINTKTCFVKNDKTRNTSTMKFRTTYCYF